MTTASETKPVESTPARGWPGIRCILCGCEDCITIHLGDATTFRCSECDDTFTDDDVIDQHRRWHAVVVWVRGAPEVE